MSELKTKKTKASVLKFIQSVKDEQKRKDSKELLKIFKEITKEKPAMWGKSIIGFGSYHYKSSRSSQEGDWFFTGFSPRKKALTLYIMSLYDNYKQELKKLGKHKKGVCCLFIKKLSDVNINVLKKIIKSSVKNTKKIY